MIPYCIRLLHTCEVAGVALAVVDVGVGGAEMTIFIGRTLAAHEAGAAIEHVITYAALGAPFVTNDDGLQVGVFCKHSAHRGHFGRVEACEVKLRQRWATIESGYHLRHIGRLQPVQMPYFHEVGHVGKEIVKDCHPLVIAERFVKVDGGDVFVAIPTLPYIIWNDIPDGTRATVLHLVVEDGHRHLAVVHGVGFGDDIDDYWLVFYNATAIAYALPTALEGSSLG